MLYLDEQARVKLKSAKYSSSFRGKKKGSFFAVAESVKHHFETSLRFSMTKGMFSDVIVQSLFNLRYEFAHRRLYPVFKVTSKGKERVKLKYIFNFKPFSFDIELLVSPN